MTLFEENNKLTTRILSLIGSHADKRGVILTSIRLKVDRAGNLIGLTRTFKHKEKNKSGKIVWR